MLIIGFRNPNQKSQLTCELLTFSKQINKQIKFLQQQFQACACEQTIMLQLIPQRFKLAKFIQMDILQQMQNDSFTIKTPISLFKSSQQTFALAISSKYLCFGIIQQNDILFVNYIPFIKGLYFQKIYHQVQMKPQIVGYKFTYQNDQLQVLIRDKSAAELITQKLGSKLTQRGFHQEYKPIRRVGKGGFATVYQVKRICDGKTFAAKAFSKQKVYSKPHDKQMIQNQIQVSRGLNHKNLLRLFQIFQSQNSLYLVMQMYQGGDLISLMKRKNANFTENQVISFMNDLFSGLKYLQDNNIMHRDMKPQNIMIRNVNHGNHDRQELVFVDFGLSSKTDIPKYLLERCGTPGYVAPEVVFFKAGDKLTPRCDVFSLGVIFHIFLSRNHLFEGKDAEEVYLNNKNLKFDLNDNKYSKINLNAMDLLKKMLIKYPEQRITADLALHHNYFGGINFNQMIPQTVKSPKMQSQKKFSNKLNTLTQTTLQSVEAS